MSRKRHYERWTNRDMPPPPPSLHGNAYNWFSKAGPHRGKENWDAILDALEQTRSAYMSKLRATPDLDRHEGAFKTVSDVDGRRVKATWSPKVLDTLIQGIQQMYGLPEMPDSPTPDQLQEALTQLSSVLKPEPYRPQQQDNQQGGGDGGGNGDGDDEDEGDDGNQQSSPPKSSPPKSQQPSGRPKKPPKPPKPPKPEKPPEEQPEEQPEEEQQQPPSSQPSPFPPEPDEDDYDDDDDDDDDDDYDDEDEDDDEPPAMQSGIGGGGEQTYSSPEDIAFAQARQAILNLCVSRTPLERPELGDEPYNLRRVAKSAYNPAMLSSIRDQLGLTVDDVYLLLDTSGSVARYAPLIASVAAAAAGIVHIYTGTEARPEMKVERSSPLASAHDAFPEWWRQKRLHSDKSVFLPFVNEYQAVVHHGYPRSEIYISFEAEMAWFLKQECPPKGSHIIIWTDTECCGVHNPLALRALLSDYKVVLMTPYTREEVISRHRPFMPAYKHEGIVFPDGADILSVMVDHGLEVTNASHRTYVEVYKFLAIDIPVIFGVKDGVAFAQALRKL